LTYFDKDVPFRAAVEKVQDKMLGFDRVAFSLNTHQPYGINDPIFLSQTANFVEWARSQPEVTQVISYTDTLKNINMVMQDNQAGSYSLPATSEEAGQLLLTYELSLPFGADLNHLIDHQKEALRISIGLTSQSANTLIDFENRAQIWISENMAKNFDISPGASVSMMFAHLGANNINSMITGNIIVTILVTLSLIIILGSLKFGLLTLLPNIVPALMAFGIWGVFVGEINMAVAVVFCLTLGIVVDDTVHFTSKYLYGRRNLKLQPAHAMEFAYLRVGKALLITTITLVTGFLVLCFSSLKVNSAMGILVAMTIFIAFVFDLFVFPRLLVLVDSKENLTAHDDANNLSETSVANG
ncbi:MAG: MMPL family transporter, partial [Pseudomonadales bacterium]|nr:MMPL family transporter [Pseudomonadales bacterium]